MHQSRAGAGGKAWLVWRGLLRGYDGGDREEPGVAQVQLSQEAECRMDWLDLLAVQGTLKSLLQRHRSKASILWPSREQPDSPIHWERSG